MPDTATTIQQLHSAVVHEISTLLDRTGFPAAAKEDFLEKLSTELSKALVVAVLKTLSRAERGEFIHALENGNEQVRKFIVLHSEHLKKPLYESLEQFRQSFVARYQEEAGKISS